MMGKQGTMQADPRAAIERLNREKAQLIRLDAAMFTLPEDTGLKGIVQDWLASHGYDGLQNGECGCGRGYLMACGEPGMGCSAAYAFDCDGCGEEYCPGRLEYADIVFSTDKDYCTSCKADGGGIG